MCRFHSFLIFLTFTNIFCVSPRAEAQVEPSPGGVRSEVSGLSWRAPIDCPSQQAMEVRVAELVGRPLSSFQPPSITVSIEKGANTTAGAIFRVRLSVELGSGTGEREFVGGDCQEVVEATALMIAFLLEPQLSPQKDLAIGEEPSTSPNPADDPREKELASQPIEGETADRLVASEKTTPQSVAVVGEASEPRLIEHREGDLRGRQKPFLEVPKKTKTSSAHWSGAVGGSGVLDFGVLGELAPGISVEGMVLFDRKWGISWGALLLPQQHVTRGEYSADFLLLTGALHFCRRAELSGWTVSFCAGTEVGNLRGKASETKNRPWVAPLASLELGVFYQRWLPFVRFTALVPVYRVDFEVGGNDVHVVPPVIARAQIGSYFYF